MTNYKHEDNVKAVTFIGSLSSYQRHWENIVK